MPRVGSISLNDFTRLAEQAPAAKDGATYIKISGGRLKTTGSWNTAVTWPSTKRATIEAFVGALREKFGYRIANLIDSQHLVALKGAGRSLTARLVKDLTVQAQEEKERVNAHNQEVVEGFLGELSGRETDPQCNLAKSARELCAKEGLRDPEDQDVLLKRLATNLMAKANRGGFFPDLLTPQVLHEKVLGLVTICPDNEQEAIQNSQILPGSLKQRLELADLGLSPLSFSRAVAELGDIRRLQAEELADAHRLQELKTTPLTPAAVYKGLFKEALPARLENDQEIIAEINGRCETDMTNLLNGVEGGESAKSKARDNVYLNAKTIPWAKLAPMAVRPNTITLDDVPHVAAFITRQKDPKEVEKLLLKDPPRVETAFRDEDGNIIELPPPTYSFKFNGAETQSVRVGRKTDFFGEVPAGTRNTDKEAYLGGIRNNSLTESLKALCEEVCGGKEATEEQKTSAMYCLTQSPKATLSSASRLAGAGFTVHANVSVTLSRQDDGSVKAEFSSPEDQRAKDAIGYFKMTLNIAKDGRMTVDEYRMEPRRAVREERAAEAADAAIQARAARTKAAREQAEPFCAAHNLAALSIQELGGKLGLAPEDSTPGRLYQAHFRKPPPPGLSDDDAILAVSNSLSDRLNGQGGSNSLTAQIQARAEALARDMGLGPAPKVIGRLWAPLTGAINGNITELARTRPGALSNDDILKVREKALEETFGRLKRGADMLPEGAGRAAFARGCLARGVIPDPVLAAPIMRRAETAAQRFEALLKARDGREAIGLMNTLFREMSAPLGDPAARLGGDAIVDARNLALHLGLASLANDPAALAQTLTRPGPFRDMLYEAKRDSDSNLRVGRQMILDSLQGLLPEATIQALRATSERDLSLARQREILGQGVYAARGVDVAVEGLQGLNGVMSRDMQAFNARIKAMVREDLLQGPGGPESRARRTEEGLNERFGQDFERDGVFVNGRLHHPGLTGTSERAFKALFPNQVAERLSNIANQALSGKVRRALSTTPGTGLTWGALNHTVFANQAMTNPRVERNLGIDIVNAEKGLYRVSAFCANISKDPNSALERFMYEVSVDVDLGPPVMGGGAPPQPKVLDARMDFLARGRELVPGE